MPFSKFYKDFSGEVNSLLTQIKRFRKRIDGFLLISNEMSLVCTYVINSFRSFDFIFRFYEKILLNSSEREANTKPKKKKIVNNELN